LSDDTSSLRSLPPLAMGGRDTIAQPATATQNPTTHQRRNTITRAYHCSSALGRQRLRGTASSLIEASGPVRSAASPLSQRLRVAVCRTRSPAPGNWRRPCNARGRHGATHDSDVKTRCPQCTLVEARPGRRGGTSPVRARARRPSRPASARAVRPR
jgi:hypothetical protein